MSNKVYRKRPGTSGIQGQLYETKLLSLINFRALHDDNIKDFALASNIDKIGAFDDICFRGKFKDLDKPIAVFIQAKHREIDKILTLNSKTDLVKYFNSYLAIKRNFDLKNKDVIFDGKFDETECFFVMYTTAKDMNNGQYVGQLADYLNKLIGTGEDCTQPSYRDDAEDIDFLCKVVIKEQIAALASFIGKFICDGSDTELSMNNDLILQYHVILTLNVFDVSEVQPEGHRIAIFRADFFESNDEFLVLFKNLLCIEVLKMRKTENSDTHSLLLKLFNEAFDVAVLSKLLGNVLTYKNGKLKFVDKSTTDDLKRQLDKVNIPESAVYEAAEMATKDFLLTLKLKVSAFFGNKDIAIRGKDEKIQKRITYLTTNLVEIIHQSNPNKIVLIDESLGDGFLQLNGGIASMVGNILVLDESSKLLKFTDNYESLGKVSKILYESLKSKIENLQEYKFDVKVKKFPKLTLERGEYDMNLVKDFYRKFLFFTNQADQSGVEEILRAEIEEYPCNDINNFRVRSDVIFLKYHDEIQKLWMTPKEGTFLTKKSKIYENAVNNTMSEPLIGVINMMHKFKNKDCIFNDDAVKKMEAHGDLVGTMIATSNCVLTVAKLKQCLKNKDHTVLDLEYIFKLPLKNHNTLCKELTNSKDKILIIVGNKLDISRNNSKRLDNIAKAVDGKQIIIVADQTTVDTMPKYFYQANILNDEKNLLTDLTADSQKKVIANSKVNFQGEDLSLDIILDNESTGFIGEEELNKIINEETIIIGKTYFSASYEKAKHFNIDRRVSRKQEENTNEIKDKVIRTLHDLKDDLVLITALFGMGKSNLLTHLSVETTEVDPKLWIVRINLLEHTKQFSDWHDCRTDNITSIESLKFICLAAINNKDDDKFIIELKEVDDTVTLKWCSGDNAIVFQLKLFLHFYNKGKLIFLFDGFDVIFPYYFHPALLLVKSLRNCPKKHKIWITIRSINRIKTSFEHEFGRPYYEIEHFTQKEQDTYLNTYWKSKIQFKNPNKEQNMQNVNNFIDFLRCTHMPTGRFCVHSKIMDKPYFKVYLNFMEYLKKESIATDKDFSYDDFDSHMLRFDTQKSVITTYIANKCIFIAPPLDLYLLAEYCHSKIKDNEILWNRDAPWNFHRPRDRSVPIEFSRYRSQWLHFV